ncbi:MAG: toll/interleukin-1 receptor domain-containing protein [Candidatus Thiodiazotropha endolucinida]
MTSVFMSYSHTDEALRDELEKHLAGLRRQGVISTWHDRRIGPGEELHGQISAQLDTADIILLLVSADFLASDYCYDVEMKRAMERHEQGNARVIPVILRPCHWQGAPFSKLMAVPTDAKPVVKHASLDDGFLEVARAIRQAIESLGSVAAAVNPSGDVEGAIAPAQPGPRSSNLRVRKEFTDRERHAYLNEAFDYVARYFENSLQELQARNSEVETDFRRIDANRFEARAFVKGQEQSRCGIWLGSLSRTDGLYFSFDGVGNYNSYNESMSVGDDGSTMFLEPMGMAHFGQNGDKELTDEGAAEFYWNMFIERLR